MTGIFDAHRPPSDDVIADCVHCGFCLPACPTYLLWGNEMDSPRGRIQLMKMGLEGSVDLDDVYARHFDACLGCLACVPACPSGVRYDDLLAAVRPQLERHHPRRPADRLFRELIFQLMPYPSRLRIAAALGILFQRAGRPLAKHLPDRLRTLDTLLPPVRLRELSRGLPAFVPARGTPRRGRVGLLTGCVQRVLFAGVNAATVRVLAREGYDVVVPRGQRCCGALSEHAGREPEAMRWARRLIDTFDEAAVDTVVVNVAGCGSTMKEYARLLRDDPRYADRAATFAATVRDVSELLTEADPVAPRHPIEARVAYHDACHLQHGQGVHAQPRAVLRTIPGLAVVDLPEPGVCCGSAGIYNLVEPATGADLGRRKADHVTSVAPDALVTANAGCLIQLRRYLPPGLPMLHPVELVDASIRGLRFPPP
jgi:glycolate oxidase iron-sulfur subunit